MIVRGVAYIELLKVTHAGRVVRVRKVRGHVPVEIF